MKTLQELAFSLAAIGLIGIGVLIAFCPINDKDTSRTHRIVTGIGTVAAICLVWRLLCAS